MIDRKTPPSLSSFSDLSLTFPPQIKLSNGIPCWIVNGGDDEMNRVSIYLNGGTMMESKPAQSTLAAILLTAGNQMLSPDELAEKFDYYGVRKSADSYDYWSEVVMTSLNENFEQTMQLLMDCIEHPSYPEQEVETLKHRVASNLSIISEKVKYMASTRMKELYYGSQNPMGRIFTPEAIMSLTRDDLIAFQQQYFTPDNCLVIVAGRVNERIIEIINSTLGQWQPTGIKNEMPQWTINSSPMMLDIVDKPGALQSGIRMRIAAVKRNHPDYIPLRVLIMVFGGYFGSRLMMNIREDKGYTYGIHASLLGIQNDGCIDISCECATQHTWKVIDEVKLEMKRLREELIPVEELNTVKQHMLSALAKTHDTPYNIAGYVTSTILFGVYPEYHNDQLRCLEMVTPQQLRDLAIKYLDDAHLRIVIAGDATAIQ